MDKQHKIILLIKSQADKELLRDFLGNLNFAVHDKLPVELQAKLSISMILVDEYYAQFFQSQLMLFKEQIDVSFLPIIVLIPQKVKGNYFLEAGYDEVIRIPVIKKEFMIRIQSLLRLRENAETQYKMIFKNINIGIYKMSADKRITSANSTFITLIGLDNISEVLNHTLDELGIFTDKERKAKIEKLTLVDNKLVYESIWKINHLKVYLRENIYLVSTKNSISYIGTVEDLTQRKEIEIALRVNEEKYRQLIEYSPYGIFIVKDNKIVFTNNAFIRMMKGKNATDFYGLPIMNFLHADYHEIVKNRIAKASNNLVINDKVEEKFYCLDKSVIDVEVVSCGINYEGHAAIQVTVNDITENIKSKKLIDHMAFHDSLTDIPNRLCFEKKVSELILHAKKYNDHFAILFIDLDNFKNINDTLGHRMGDLLLIEVAKRISKSVGITDTVGRLGGDEFVVEIDCSKHNDFQLKETIERMIFSIQEPYAVDNHILNVTASVGISIYPNDGEDLITLFKNADMAMYSAKQKGKNNFQFYSCELTKIIDEKVSIEKDLRKAITNNELYLCFQPKLNLRTGLITGAESLLRWLHPTLGPVSPTRFIPVAEEAGLIHTITEFVLLHTCKQINKCKELGINIKIAINLSVKSFQNNNLLASFVHILEQENVNPANIEIEITESFIMQDHIKSKAILSTFKNMGMTISIDDFGTGYSSLNYLRYLEIDTLKIDASFIRDMHFDSNDSAIVIAIIVMAHTLKLKVIAEGVETEAQLRYLKDHDCDEIQGFYFSKPIPGDELIKLVIQQNNQ